MSSARYGSTAHRVLEIPEILELVLSFMDQKSNSSNACVCKKWSDIALNLVWRNVANLSRLFSLLAPMAKINYPVALMTTTRVGWGFEKSLEASDWERFMPYARRVRTVTYNQRDKRDIITQLSSEIDITPIASQAFDEIARTRLTLNILPNLRELVWLTLTPERMRLSLIFMHENVTHFSVFLHGTQWASFFNEIALRMPNLTHLDLRFIAPVREGEVDLVDLLSRLKKLMRIILPLFCLTTKVIEALSRLPHMGIIQFEFMESQGRGEMVDVMHFAPRMEEGAFPSLWDLSLNANLPDMTTFLDSNFSPTNLTSLYVHVLTECQPSDVTKFLTVASDNCQLLTHLYIDFLRSPVEDAPDFVGDRGRLTWESLRPILSFPNLVAFELRWNMPLVISQAGIEELASKSPSLRVLLLNCEPMDPAVESTLTLQALVPFARHCPKLEELGLFVSASSAATTDLHPLGPSIKPFKCLKRLSMGLSRITEPGPVALFLSQLCPLGCELTSGVTWPEGFGMSETPTNAQRLEEIQTQAGLWWKSWTEVNEMLPLLTRLRMEERDNRQALEKEVEELRIRCRLLAERAGPALNGDASCVAL